ncbi:heterokaryon incompatibility protein-domain-containing protein [Stachybotrys elegans]|uniref:Heterokaryon incompatibility protein-domain-containing protein n=1 Tax=Stachybotrys elegans TaxID=80388 RepID=A0A8K0SJ33_9HYPO|nr:heterokaryon incompatibility protein-domain-containing protein [Stachybotrys elegans]
MDYVYTPLSGPRRTRILVLGTSTTAESPLEGDLIEISVDRPWPFYEAVSYTWGGQSPDRHMTIGGKKLLITKNCEDLLRNFRNPRHRDAPKKRRLWVDSICINQSDVQEKNVQVQMMGDIYKKCKQVLVWLGHATTESDLCFQIIREMTQRWWNPFKSKSKMIEETLEKLQARPELIIDVISRPWFSRTWTLQESATGNFVVLFCGKEKLLIRTFFSVYMSMGGLTLYGLDIPTSREITERTSTHYRIRASIRGDGANESMFRHQRKLDVLYVLHDIRLCESFDPKDKIFALHSIMQRCGVHLPAPDYTKSLSDIYYEATLTIIKTLPKVQAVKLLQLVTGHQNPELCDAPSWVPDYSEVVPPLSLFNHGFDATIGAQPVFRFSEDGRQLSITGIRVDQVEEVSSMSIWYPDRLLSIDNDIIWETLEGNPEKTVRAFQDWIRIAGALSTYSRTDETTQEAFFATIGAKRGNMDTHKIETINRALRETEGADENDMAVILEQWQGHTFAEDAQRWWSLLENASSGGMALVADICRKTPSQSLIRRRFGNSFDVLKAEQSDEWKILVALSTFTGICATILSACRKNTFFRTSGGYIGTGPLSIRHGDTIVFIGGLETPMVVRPDGAHHRLIGPAYVHGMMDGEMFRDIMAKAFLFAPQDENVSVLEMTLV